MEAQCSKYMVGNVPKTMHPSILPYIVVAAHEACYKLSFPRRRTVDRRLIRSLGNGRWRETGDQAATVYQSISGFKGTNLVHIVRLLQVKFRLPLR